MEKFGVDTDEKTTKEASDESRQTCPRCASPLLPPENNNVPRCPNCGTEPFESR